MADKNPYMMAVLRDFNAKLNSWYANGNTNIEGTKIDILTASFGFNQIINKPTHILNNSSSCINLIVTSQPMITTKSSNRIILSLQANCHHQIINVKFNLNVNYPPPYKREVWHYKLASPNCIQHAIANFGWKNTFHNADVNKQVMLFNETFLNII